MAADAADADDGWHLQRVRDFAEETTLGVSLVSRRLGRRLGRIAEPRIGSFFWCPTRLAVIEDVAGSEPSVCRLRGGLRCDPRSSDRLFAAF